MAERWNNSSCDLLNVGCILPPGHEGPHYNDSADVAWHKPSVVDRQIIQAEMARLTDGVQ